jgi:CsoR family transcriptional regulator, copper-sensing transcriptional repressor
VGVSGLTAVFVALVLADPTSTARQLLEETFGAVGLVPVVLAGAILAAATYVVLRYGRREQEQGEQEE